jgi:hypothetical protein
MSRSRLLEAAVAALLLVLAPRAGLAQPEGQQLDAIGTLDYAHGRSTIHVGTWVKYHVTSRSERGGSDDYTVTQLIAGEEEFWGEDCFWVETWTESPGKGTSAAASLMSYSIFDDSMAVADVKLYVRKKILGLDNNDKPNIQAYRPPATALMSRNPLGDDARTKQDTLGTETVTTPKGDFLCTKLRTERFRSKTADVGDSTEYTEGREVRVSDLTTRVPLTSLARVHMDTGYWRRAWLIGRSKDSGPMRVFDQAKTDIELLDFGTGGLTPLAVPENVRRSLAEQRAAAHGKTPAAASSPGGARPGVPPGGKTTR